LNSLYKSFLFPLLALIAETHFKLYGKYDDYNIGCSLCSWWCLFSWPKRSLWI